MSGAEALRQIEAAAQREVFLRADLIARALTVSSRQFLRDWRRRKFPETRVGRRTVLLPARLVYATYFTSVESADSGLSGTIDLRAAAKVSSNRILARQRYTRYVSQLLEE